MTRLRSRGLEIGNPVDKKQWRGREEQLNTRQGSYRNSIMTSVPLLCSRSEMSTGAGFCTRKSFHQVETTSHRSTYSELLHPSKQLVIQCYASNLGLGAALLQDDRPIANASRALTDTYNRYYAVVEK